MSNQNSEEGNYTPKFRNERRIIQISAHAGDRDGYAAVYALCDDGTLWRRLSGHSEPEWKQIENVPDMEPQE